MHVDGDSATIESKRTCWSLEHQTNQQMNEWNQQINQQINQIN